MGIIKNLINKVLDAEVPPTIERFVTKTVKTNKKPKLTPEFGTVMYPERYIPDNSAEAKQIRAKQEKYKDETTDQRLKRLSNETRIRMEAAGLKMYVWETSGDERVRSCCRKMDGKLCLWSNPTVYSRNKGKDWIPRPKGATVTHPGEKTVAVVQPSHTNPNFWANRSNHATDSLYSGKKAFASRLKCR